MCAQRSEAVELTADADGVRAFYHAEVAKHGYTHRGLGFNNRESQLHRFDVLRSVGDLHRARVLDVGAGLGDFVRYLWARGVVPDYTGLELCEHLVAEARRRHQGPGPARFLAGDILTADLSGPYDYVIASGIFGLETPSAAGRIIPTLTRLYELCRRAVAVNFLSARASRKAPQRLYVEPLEALARALTLTPTVTLRHDYLPNDFTLFLYREPRWTELDSEHQGGQ
ncbi:uncharacterized protein SOCEGT47_042380 [Sorangium cellulosum]|uniref:Methyltransferase domain-containing protein n=1 Tax=Sorangium cellulosum TaxID=56 RepID=A0A4P2Q3Y5_SORCE|nr:uncharacterized protein SOCEGT47_042380 [Sorangium cellulosum]